MENENLTLREKETMIEVIKKGNLQNWKACHIFLLLK